MNTDILIINGSPRKNKNCFKISQEISNTLNKNNISNKIFNIYDMNIEYCTACGFCEKTGFCKFKDEKTSCRRCPIHCYKKDMKQKVKEVMKFSGPRLILYRPVEFIKHWFY